MLSFSMVVVAKAKTATIAALQRHQGTALRGAAFSTSVAAAVALLSSSSATVFIEERALEGLAEDSATERGLEPCVAADDDAALLLTAMLLARRRCLSAFSCRATAAAVRAASTSLIVLQ